MPLGLDPVDLGVAAGIADRIAGRGSGAGAAFDLAIMGDQRVGVDLARAAAGDRIAAGNVELIVLLPFDAGIGLDLQRQIVVRAIQQLRREAGRRQTGEHRGEPENRRSGTDDPEPAPHDA